MIFKEGISPFWEDKKNLEGGHFQYFFTDIDESGLNSLWKKMVSKLMGGDMKHIEKINGVRILFKGKNRYKLEIWIGRVLKTNFYGAKENSKKIREKILNEIVADFDDCL